MNEDKEGKRCKECGQIVPDCEDKSSQWGDTGGKSISPQLGEAVAKIILALVIIGGGWAYFFGDKSSNSGSSNSYSSNGIASSNSPTSADFISPEMAKVKMAAPVNLAPAETKPFTISQVCRATIAGLFGREVNTMKAVKTDTAGVYTVSYRRPADNQLFSFDCKLSGDYVIWRESGQYSNRWSGTRDVPFNVAFMIDNSGLKISELYAGSDDISYRYTLKSFK
ncbi:hypothetical protein [uncultured Cedecea sp.]|uniref:hypothetical protein n=1 Tax=uncultured Cedecea sp. TaxID=988762 RepID=UPI00260ED586|nr:hypothetical protein [uncultured Cedecea sp.]